MRLRNVKNAEDIVNNHPLVVKSNPFQDNVCIEIGCGKGDFISGMAKENPKMNFIGIEKYDSILVRALEKNNEEISNLRFMCMDATNLEEVFNHNVDTIYLNFSDPWPKKRHAKRRLTSPNFLKIYENISKNDVHIKMKTDNKGLFAYSIVEFNNNGYVFNDLSFDLTNSDMPNIRTEYENKFINKGVTINYLDAIKKMHK